MLHLGSDQWPNQLFQLESPFNRRTLKQSHILGVFRWPSDVCSPEKFHLNHLCQGKPIRGLCSVSFSKGHTILFCAVWIWIKQTKSPLLMLQGAENPLPAHGGCRSCWPEGSWRRTTPRTLTVHFLNPCLHRLTAAYNHQLTWQVFYPFNSHFNHALGNSLFTQLHHA